MILVLRPATEDARAFVADSFVRSYQGGTTPLVHVDPIARAMALRRWLATQWAHVKVLTGDREDLYLGWALPVEGTTEAWYVYVKHDLRRQGLAREALRMLGCTTVRLTTRAWQEEYRVKETEQDYRR